MTDTDTPTTPSVPELLAHLDEAEHTIASLRARGVTLNVEVRVRDARIAQLEDELAALREASPETPEETR